MGMLYSFELQIMGIILFSVMIIGGISLWYKRRKIRKESEDTKNDEFYNMG